MANSVYENNANVDLPLNLPLPSNLCDNKPAEGAFDTLLYLGENTCTPQRVYVWMRVFLVWASCFTVIIGLFCMDLIHVYLCMYVILCI